MSPIMSSRDNLKPYDYQPYDYVGALDRLGGDTGLFRDLARMFAVDSVALMERLRSATVRGDRKEAALASHALLGLAATFTAVRVTTEAGRIESAARDTDAALISDFDELEAAVTDLNAALRQLPDES